MLRVMLLIFMIGLVSALDVELSCPKDVFADEEFECELEVFDGEGIYDLKVEIDSERDSVLKILNEGEWKSSYYYLKKFVRDDEVVKLKILESGKYDIVVKLRQGNEKEEFDALRIKVKRMETSDTVDVNLTEKSVEVILLGGNVVVENEEEWDYISKDGWIVDLLPYGFCLFLILLIGVLMWTQAS